jgi:hypothetical protein
MRPHFRDHPLESVSSFLGPEELRTGSGRRDADCDHWPHCIVFGFESSATAVFGNDLVTIFRVIVIFGEPG